MTLRAKLDGLMLNDESDTWLNWLILRVKPISRGEVA